MVDKKLSDNLPFVDESTPAAPGSPSTEFPDIEADPLYTPSEISTQQAEQEYKVWEDYEIISKKLRNDRYEEDTIHRRNLSSWAAIIVSIWLFSVILILIRNTSEYKLSDAVMIALLGTTTLNVLGMMMIVLKGLFFEDNKE